jgi:molecular chaperone DnaK (HSP70)
VRLGVDFGTTHTVVAYADRGNYPVLSFADEGGDFHDFYPSVVAEREGELCFGFSALALAGDPDATLVRSFKRFLSDPKASPAKQVEVGSVRLPLGELLTRFLAALRAAILDRSNLGDEQKSSSEPMHCVIAVPAHGHGGQRFMTLDAFRRAGFLPEAMLNEPSAAGFEFTHRHRSSLTAKREHVVVYDLGGGTFDASLVRIRGTHHEILDTQGLSWVGGDEFDAALLELVFTRASLSRSDLPKGALGRVLEQCREAKERLSPNSRKISIDLETSLGDLAPRPELTVSVDDYYDACTPLVEKTIAAMAPVLERLERELANDADGDGLAGIYVVGGASALPLVARLVRKRFGRRVHKSPYPSAAVAIGLAIASDESADFELSDRFTRTFGVFREGAAGHEITFDPIFTRDCRVPHANGARLSFRRSYLAVHNVGHFRFLECDAVGDDGRPTGDGVLSGDVLFPFDPSLCEDTRDLESVPVQRNDRARRIEEEYTLDEHGMVAVTIRNLDADYQRVFHLGR